MELSCKVKYALLALLELTSHYEQGSFLQIDQIVAAQQVPDRYLAQLLMMLRRGGLVRSQKGAKGGYLLAQDPQRITLLKVVICLEGKPQKQPSTENDDQTLESVVIEQVWQEAVEASMAVLGRYTLQDLCDKRNQNQQLNFMYYI